MKLAWAIPTAACVMIVAQGARAQEPGVFTGNLVPRSAEYVPDRVVVGFASTVTDEDAARIVNGLRQGASVRGRALRNAFHVLTVPPGRVWQVVNALRADPRVRYAHPDWIAHALEIPPTIPSIRGSGTSRARILRPAASGSREPGPSIPVAIPR